MASRELSVIITGDVRRIRNALGELGSDLDRTNRQTDESSGRWAKWGRAAATGAALGVTALVAFGAAAVSANAEFEQQMSAVEAVSQATGAEMDVLSEKALQLGRDTSFSATEAGSAMEELVKAGLTTEDVLGGAADATVALAAAGGVELADAATIAANALNAFNLEAADMGRIADVVAGAANTSAIDVSEFGQSMQQASAVANLVGLSFEDTATAIGLLGDAGIRGSDAGTSLKTMLTRLTPQTEAQADAMRELGLLTEEGTSKFYDQQGALHGLDDVAGILQESLRGLTDEQLQQALYDIFGSDALRAGAILFGEGAAGVRDFAASMGDISAAEVAETRLDNLMGSVEQFKGSIESFLIESGGGLNAGLRALVDTGTEAVNWMANPPEGLTDWAQNAGDTIRSVATPAIEDLADAGENLWDLLVGIYDDGDEVVGMLGRLGGGGAAATLRGTASAIETVTGVLADHEDQVLAAAAAYVGFAVAPTVIKGVTAAWAAMSAVPGIMAAVNAQLWIAQSASAAAGGSIGRLPVLMNLTATSAQNMGSRFLMSGAAMSVAAAAGAAALALLYMSWQNSHQKQEEWRRGVEAEIDFTSVDSIVQGLDEADRHMDTSRVKIDSWASGVAAGGKGIAEWLNPWADNTVIDTLRATDASEKARREFDAMSLELQDAYAAVGRQARLSGDVVEAWARKLEIDPLAEDGQRRLADGIHDATRLAEKGGPPAEALAEAYGIVAEETSSATDEMAAWNEIIKAVMGVHVSYEQAIVGQAESLRQLAVADDEARAAGDEWSTSLDLGTEAGNRNRSTLSGLIDGAVGVAEKFYEAGGSMEEANNVLAMQREAFLQAAEAAGFSRDEVEGYLDATDQWPTDLSTYMHVEGADVVDQAVDNAARPRETPVTAMADLASVATAQRYMAQAAAPRTARLIAELDPASAATAERYIAQAARNRTVYLLLELDTASRATAERYIGQAQAAAAGSRWGNVFEYARGGITQAHALGPGPTIFKYREPETGGEAFIPRLGDRDRSLSIMAKVGEWLDVGIIDKKRLREDEPGWNWQTMGNGMAGPGVMAQYPNGLMGGSSTATATSSWSNARRTMSSSGAASVPSTQTIVSNITVELDGKAVGSARSVYRAIADQADDDRRGHL